MFEDSLTFYDGLHVTFDRVYVVQSDEEVAWSERGHGGTPFTCKTQVKFQSTTGGVTRQKSDEGLLLC